jgi:acetyl/propionyl-CoA carboxylase alpha subunit
VISKLLVANRGEIALRIFRTCRQLGIKTVAVFSEADRRARFVSEAGEAVSLGGSTPAESYLRIEALLDSARQTGAEAVHPGYGFLAESPDFARAVLEAGLVWVGPPPEVLELVGSKLAAKELAARAGVPVMKSVEVGGEADLAAAGDELGWPLLVKASAGGGGKGMRVVSDPTYLAEAVEGARREAGSAFGDDTVFLEACLEAPRHVEIQVAADTQGNVVSLFERECSIQRRYQKIIEESPSTALDEATRSAMGEAAEAIARAAGYVGLGTVEFLHDQNGFRFLEVNPRLQVEHPVTEEVTGLDLVALQLEVAGGAPLPEAALNPVRFGHAIEARLYAEDPGQGFLPVSGKLDRFELDDERVRVETGIGGGDEVSIHYDPLLAKVISFGESREEAARVLAEALERSRIHGITTNRELLVRILRHPEFLAGQIDTHFLERHPPAALARPLPPDFEARLAAVGAALAAQAQRRESTTVQAAVPSGWRNSPSQMQEVNFSMAEGEVAVGYRFDLRNGISIELDGKRLEGAEVLSATPERVGLITDSHLRWFEVHRVGSVHHVDGPHGYTRLEEKPRFPTAASEQERGSLRAPMPGKVVKVTVSEGEAVTEGQILVVMEAMKMEHALRAPHPGTVSAVPAAPGDQVEAGTTLVVVDSQAGSGLG